MGVNETNVCEKDTGVRAHTQTSLFFDARKKKQDLAKQAFKFHNKRNEKLRRK